MATIQPTKTSEESTLYLWETLTEADTAAPVRLGPIKGAAQVVGTWGGATIAFQGSLDGTNYVTLEDLEDGDAITMSANGAFQFESNFIYHRFHATTPGTSRDVDCYLNVND